ncbi:MAG: motility protein A [Candidatus Binatia bacterium]
MKRFMLVAAIVAGGLFAGWHLLPEFINVPSLFITVGGTVAVTLFTFSWTRVCEVGKVLYALSHAEPQTLEARITELKRLAHLYHVGGLRGLENQERSITDPFLRSGVKMVVDLRKERDIQNSLEQELLAFFHRYESAMQVLLVVGKLLPAFGLIGTLIGLILLFHQIPTLEPQTLPSSISVAVLTTLYGALLANVVVLPLAAKLQSFEQEQEAIMRLSLAGILLLAHGESPTTIEHQLRAIFLSPSTDQHATTRIPQPSLDLHKPVFSRVER